MTRLDQTRDQVASTTEPGSAQLQEYRLGTAKTQVEKKTQAPPAAAPDGTGYADAGSSSSNEIIRHWKPDHGQSKSGKAWFKAMKHQEPVPVAGNYYTVKDGDCLESIARRELRTENHAVDTKSTNAGVEQLIALNKDHYKSLTVNKHYIQNGWKLKLSAADLASADVVAPPTKPVDASVPVGAPDATADKVNQGASTPKDNGAVNAVAPDTPPPVNPAADAKAPDANPDAKAPDAKAPDTPPTKNAPEPANGADKSPPKAPDLIDKLSSYGKEACDEAKKIGHDHPWLVGAGALIGTAAILALSKGKLSKLFGAEKELSVTSQAIEREAVLAKVGAIPDVERPLIASIVTSEVPKEFEKAATEYRSSLLKLKNDLPSHYTIGETETVPDLAKRVLEERAPITGERINPATISTEAERIQGLNPNINQINGDQRLLVHDAPAISKLAETTRFKHVPQIGQLLKQHGVSEDNVQEAFRIQNSLPKENRPLIGQILVDSKLATKPQVDQAFEQQNSLKAMLKDVQNEVLPTK
jgi:LysM repeat protein